MKSEEEEEGVVSVSSLKKNHVIQIIITITVHDLPKIMGQ